MKNPWPMTLAGRTLLILLLGLTSSHILSILVFTSEKLEAAVSANEGEVLTRMAVVTRLLLEVPSTLHEPILAAMNRSGIHFEARHQTSPDQGPLPSGNNESLRRHLEEEIGSPRAKVVAVNVVEPDWNHPYGTLHRLLFGLEMGIIRLMHDQAMDREVSAWVELPPGHHLYLSTRPAANHVPLFRHATISVIIMTGAIFLFSLVTARHMTSPLHRIVQAADTLGQDIYADPLPEQGVVEVVTVARAFNRMNRKIREFVEERLHMIAAISHDLRTPLTKLKLLAEFVGDENTRSRMVATLDEMESMLAATLTFAREATSVEPKQPVNLSGLLSAICADLTDAGLPATCEDRDRQTCHCRPLAMKRALTNLIHNAVKYGGEARVSLCREGTRLVVTIYDPGPGIPEQEWGNVFKPFRRLDLSRSLDTGGVGLGLSIAASVIHDHDGSIRFMHPPEGGFMTRVELPATGHVRSS